MKNELKKHSFIILPFILSLVLFSIFGSGCGEDPIVSIRTTIPYDLVDLSGHCYWFTTSNYEKDIRQCVKTWNKYAPDIFVERLEPEKYVKIIDVHEFGTNWAGRIDMAGKKIELNLYFFSSEEFRKDNRLVRNTILHELGHALGLGHQTENTGGSEKDIMWKDTTTSTTLSKNDKASFDAAAKRY